MNPTYLSLILFVYKHLSNICLVHIHILHGKSSELCFRMTQKRGEMRKNLDDQVLIGKLVKKIFWSLSIVKCRYRLYDWIFLIEKNILRYDMSNE